jgi:hypothetical protein
LIKTPSGTCCFWYICTSEIIFIGFVKDCYTMWWENTGGHAALKRRQVPALLLAIMQERLQEGLPIPIHCCWERYGGQRLHCAPSSSIGPLSKPAAPGVPSTRELHDVRRLPATWILRLYPGPRSSTSASRDVRPRDYTTHLG